MSKRRGAQLLREAIKHIKDSYPAESRVIQKAIDEYILPTMESDLKTIVSIIILTMIITSIITIITMVIIILDDPDRQEERSSGRAGQASSKPRETTEAT